jgi:hypothetical protein
MIIFGNDEVGLQWHLPDEFDFGLYMPYFTRSPKGN